MTAWMSERERRAERGWESSEYRSGVEGRRGRMDWAEVRVRE